MVPAGYVQWQIAVAFVVSVKEPSFLTARAQADWLRDSLAEGSPRAPDAARAIAREVARVELSLGTIVALAASASAPRLQEGVDPNALFGPMVATRCADLDAGSEHDDRSDGGDDLQSLWSH